MYILVGASVVTLVVISLKKLKNINLTLTASIYIGSDRRVRIGKKKGASAPSRLQALVKFNKKSQKA